MSVPMRLFLCKRCKERIVTLGAARIRRCPACSDRLAEVWMPTPPRAAPDTYVQDEQTYASMDDFVAADSRRLVSREVDFGLYWRERNGDATYRAAWIDETRELYVVQAGPTQAGGGHLEVLAISDRASVDTALEGWAERCPQPASLDWLRRRAGRIRTEDQSLPADRRPGASQQELSRATVRARDEARFGRRVLDELHPLGRLHVLRHRPRLSREAVRTNPVVRGTDSSPD